MFSNDMYQIAVDLINQYGDDAVLEKIVLGTYNPSIGERPETITSYNTKVIQENFSYNDIQSGLIESGDQLVSISIDQPITPQDRIQIQGVDYNILDVSPISTQNKVVLYQLHVRGVK
jgi:hypothetical protein